MQCDLAPMADGGEGTLDALCPEGSALQQWRVTGPLGAPVQARFGLLADGATAVLEMAEAAGLALVPPDRRDPLIATTRGVGELMLRALDCGATRILIGIGGSATNDGGAGMAQALGARLLDKAGRDIAPGGRALLDLDRIDVSSLDPRIAATAVDIASDVRNPLIGEHGASAVYGPQKGAAGEDVLLLDQALSHYAAIVRRDLGSDVASLPGSGAAGGLGAGLLAFCGARMGAGAGLIADAIGLPGRIARADWVITGEGKTDDSTLSGKVVSRVVHICREKQKPCIVVSGAVKASTAGGLYGQGATAVVSISDGPMSMEDALRRTPDLLEKTGCDLGRILMAARGGMKG